MASGASDGGLREPGLCKVPYGYECIHKAVIDFIWQHIDLYNPTYCRDRLSVDRISYGDDLVLRLSISVTDGDGDRAVVYVFDFGGDIADPGLFTQLARRLNECLYALWVGRPAPDWADVGPLQRSSSFMMDNLRAACLDVQLEYRHDDRQRERYVFRSGGRTLGTMEVYDGMLCYDGCGGRITQSLWHSDLTRTPFEHFAMMVVDRLKWHAH